METEYGNSLITPAEFREGVACVAAEVSEKFLAESPDKWMLVGQLMLSKGDLASGSRLHGVLLAD